MPPSSLSGSPTPLKRLSPERKPSPPVYSWGSRVVLHTDGRMAVEDYNGQPAWENNINSSSKAEQARLLDTGNLVVRGPGDIILWQSFDSPTDTLLPNQNITAATKLVSTHRLLVPGHYSFHFDDAHLLSLFDDQKDISFIYWPKPDLTTWARQRNPFSTTTVGLLDSWGYFLGSDNLTFKSTDWGLGIMRRLTLDYDGNLRLYSLENREWLNRQFNNLQARTMIKLAVSCVEEDSRKRPTMENAVQMLLSVDEASGIMQQYSTN
ncbi:hypothetical protein ZWY2020_002752 [Hordeum vulgare]|nr:hypothetical protein ZWY2020_002752 [Hordeum vulgare]